MFSWSSRQLLWLLALVALAVGCGEERQRASSASQPSTEDAGPIHVHGLGVNPKDRALYIATHTGLFRAAEAGGKAERVGDDQQDTMGFTVVGPDRFLGSGHPDPSQDLPPLLGLIRSSDGGQSWEPQSLSGEADFHVLRSAGERVYGFDASNARLLMSSDGGASWTQLEPPGPLLDLAIDREDPDKLVASTDQLLVTSADQGKSWKPAFRSDPGLLAWPSPESLYRVDGTGQVSVSDDAGNGWRPRGSIGGQPAAFTAVDERTLYAALPDGTIMGSSDGGAAWRVRSRP
ncbi:MAG: exo-alpha-sialidase [Thermoleophilaceae bacterium]|nr:exo-alpha-sialidase [Thermoleophilaceae bacterium]